MNGLCLSCNTNHHECQDHPFIETVDELAEYVAGLFGMPAEVFHAVVRLKIKRQQREETFQVARRRRSVQGVKDERSS